MRIRVARIAKEIWESMSAADAHLAVFHETLPPGSDRIDYALLAVDEDRDLAVAYMTIRELDSETAYLKHGGAFEPIKGGVMCLPTYLSLISELKQKYENLTTLVENGNVNYLRLAFKAGFRVTGVRYFKGNILLELQTEI